MQQWIRIHRFGVALALVAVIGLALRMIYRVAAPMTLISGDGSYFNLGGTLLADGRGFVDPFRYLLSGGTILLPGAEHPPAWTVVLAIPTWLGLRFRDQHEVFASLIGTGTIIVMGYAGRRLAGPRAGLFAAAIAALYPGFWLYERQLLSETLSVFEAALLVLLALRFRARPTWPRALWVGVLCGLLALTRTEMVLLIGVLLLPLMLVVPGTSWRRRIGWVAVGGCAAVLVITPWVAYNLSRFDRQVLISSQGGRTLSASNCDPAYYGPLLGYKSLFDPRCNRNQAAGRSVARSSGRVMNLVDASWQDAELRRLATRYLDEHRSRLPVVVLAREGRTWGLFRPFQQLHLDLISGDIWFLRLQYFMYLTMLPFAIAGGVALRRRPAQLLPLIALIVTIAVTVATTFGSTRYRAPADVAIALLAAVGVDALVRTLIRRRTRHPETGSEMSNREGPEKKAKKKKKREKLLPIGA